MKSIRYTFFLFLLLHFGCQTELFQPAKKLEISLAFQDHMVLQRDTDFPFFGTTSNGAKVEVQINGETYSTEANNNGEWTVTIPPQEAGGPYDISILAGEKTVELSDIYFGDVWLCSGQSNMKMRLSETEEATEEIMAADLPFVRHFEAKGYGAKEPQNEWPDGVWEVCTPETAGEFTAAGYYFAKFIQAEIDVPIGLVHAAWSATRIEEWMSEESFGPNVPEPPVSLDWDPDWNLENRPYRFFNQYIHPLTRLPIKGVLWYQGESNAKLEFAEDYEIQFQTLIKDWRQRWGQPDMPWIFVQLASWEPNNGVNRWAELRASQTAALSLPHTAMVVTYDISPEHDIHPKNKKDLGHRLSLAARQLVYGHNIIASGPVFENAVWDGAQERAILNFSSQGSGLISLPTGAALEGFEMAGPDGEYFPSEAWLENNEIIVVPPFGGGPSGIRYAWKNAPQEANFYNLENLPALPFLFQF